MKSYNTKEIEKKWQDFWDEQELAKAHNDSKKEKFYCLIEFPYPSGEGLHVGHPRSYTALDVIARKRRMEGYNVLYPIGWDAFGLPAENYAIKTGTHPKTTTQKNITNFKRQLKSLGFSFDWSREINTTDPSYYKWTQWIFLQFFKKGLAYKKKTTINWCPSCKVGLANEEVVDGKCERCGTAVEQREREQWMLAITKYAKRLIDDLADIDYPQRVKKQQIDWVGESQGAAIKFKICAPSVSAVGGTEKTISVFTTRPDTLFGATFLVIAPEHSLLEELKESIKNWHQIDNYRKQAKHKTSLERQKEIKEKTGEKLEGIVAINPATQKEIPIFVADYVMMDYGTGAIMAVPAHDQRDFDFAKKYNIPIQEVIESKDKKEGDVFEGEGTLINSGEFNGTSSKEAKDAITKFVGGKKETQYKLRDWVFSRQRYWGEPIPIVFCEKCGAVPLPEDQLPLILPEIEKYQTNQTGDSPLALIDEWVNTTCLNCGGKAKRETDTMPQWAGSSWYYLRYTDPGNSQALASQKALKYWAPVDWYNGGMEHTTLHLLYSRFWHKFLFDIGVVPTSEPYAKRTSHGLILGEGGEKMSKSRGNVVNPDDMVDEFGADPFRVYEMFMGPFEEAIPWSNEGMLGAERFLDRVYKAQTMIQNDTPQEVQIRLLHQTINKVSKDIETMGFNTAVSALMIMLNAMEKWEKIPRIIFEQYLLLLALFAPHLAEEIWYQQGHKNSIFKESWPVYDEKQAKDPTVTIAVQQNGKTRGTVTVRAGALQEEVEQKIKEDKMLSKFLKTKPDRIIFVTDKIINLVWMS